MKTKLRKLSLGAFLCTLSPAALATDYTAVAGGSGGTGFSLDCGANMSLVGIQGKAGSLIDSVQGVCAQFNADGSQLGRKVLTGSAGGMGGASYHLECPAGKTVIGITGHADSHVNNFKVRCGVTDFSKQAGNPSITGPGSLFILNCSTFMDARLIRGRSGIWVDAMGLGCKPAQRLQVSDVSIATGVRQGQSAPLTVTMSIVPIEPINVHLNSSNTALLPSTGVVTVGKTTTKATATVLAGSIGCARITASYKGSSASADLAVHSAASPAISLTGPVTLKRGTSIKMKVTISPTISRNSGISVQVVRSSHSGIGPNIDTKLATLANYAVSGVVNIAANTNSATFDVYGHTAGCALISAREDKAYGATVTHSIVVVD